MYMYIIVGYFNICHLCDNEVFRHFFFFFFFKQKTAYEMLRSLVGSEMCIRDSSSVSQGEAQAEVSGRRHVRLVGCLLGGMLAVAMVVTIAGGHANPEGQANPDVPRIALEELDDGHVESTYLLVRHCARAPSYVRTGIIDGGGKGSGGFVASAATEGLPGTLGGYTAEAWPDWGVAPAACLPRGTALLQELAKILKHGEKFEGIGALPLPVSVVNNGAVRFNQSANAMIEAFGDDMEVTASVLPGLQAGSCAMSGETKAKALKEQIARVPKPQNWTQLVEKLKEVIGRTANNSKVLELVESYRTGVHYGCISGPDYLWSVLVESLQEEYNAQLELGWGRLTPDELYELLPLHFYYYDMLFATDDLAKHRMGQFVAHLGSWAKHPDGTKIAVGSEVTQLGVTQLFNLSYHAPPLGYLARPPGGAFRFRHVATGDSSRIHADFIYDPALASEVYTPVVVPVTFGLTQTTSVDLKEFVEICERAVTCSPSSAAFADTLDQHEFKKNTRDQFC
eukprot:TRINITY_DN559_c0_g2_i2.p1 TRINITY_DN559_c0_g2~~TRINITY_DN559_c0_g2_i2.p1  ORF type:complete len:510 (+),score=130.69 TRINITY_DN559_c0_g2_i2:36-1565(+)